MSLDPRQLVREFLRETRLGTGFTVNHEAISEMVETYFEVFGEVEDEKELAKITPEGLIALAIWGYYFNKTGEDIRKHIPTKELIEIVREEVPDTILEEVRRLINRRR